MSITEEKKRLELIRARFVGSDSRDDLPWLLALVDRLVAENARLAGMLDEYCCTCDRPHGCVVHP